MDYDFRTISGPSLDAQVPMYRSSTSSSPPTHPMYAPPSYPNVGQQHAHAAVARPSSHPHHGVFLMEFAAGLGIRVAIKPEFRITPPPHLLPHAGDIPRSNFQFDFELEKKILAEAEKENPNWTRFGSEILPPKVAESTSPMGSVSDPIVSKYIGLGLSKEAVQIAVANYGDNPTKVQEFVNGYTLLREMGFTSSNVPEVLMMNDNDTDKALAHFLNGPS
ncbi:Ubiquitin-associated 1 [Senna tora]|uniref:Ubiquitin-associated 1 n=1 Tax=Senna tora TaxID=362788 RepID=A0A834U473_9FABA|nr:Ubiquitin-associated 1 [Senna tora]